MYKYIFQTGKNTDLNCFEIEQVLTSYNISFKEYENLRSDLISLSLDKKLGDTFIKNLAGTIRIIEIIAEIKDLEDLQAQLENIFLPSKLNAVVSLLGNIDRDFITETLKHYFKKYKHKANLKVLEHSFIKPSQFQSMNLSEGLELIVLQNNDNYVIGKTIGCTDPKKYKLKDEGRVERLFTHGTSPRLAQLLINLLGYPVSLRSKLTLLDPFCGTGTILIEALEQGFNAVGIEMDHEVFGVLKKNLMKYKNVKVIRDDSREVSQESNCVVFEPYMGEFLTNLPTLHKAKLQMQKLSTLYTRIFSTISSNSQGNENVFKIVCILPFYETREGETVETPNSVFQNSGFKLVESNLGINLPIVYKSAGKNLIGRKIYVLEK